jgi:hypothetical protein
MKHWKQKPEDRWTYYAMKKLARTAYATGGRDDTSAELFMSHRFFHFMTFGLFEEDKQQWI